LLKVVHLVAGDELGGAVRAALSLHYELKKAEIDSKILLQFGKSNSSDIEVVDKTKTNDAMRRLRYIKDQIPFRFHPNRKKYIFSPGIFGMNLSDHNLIKDADVVHLNWITNGYVDLRTFRLFKKPIVWTLHDMWPFTGGCHYSLSCSNFKTGCGNCHHLGSKKLNDLSRWLVKRKKNFYQVPFTPVAVSNWLKKCAEESYLLSDKRTELIHNGVDISLFKPQEIEFVRNKLNLPIKKKIILIDGQCTKHIWKGRNELQICLENLKNEEMLLLFFGDTNESFINKLGIDSKNFGRITNDEMLCDVYNSADVFLTSTIQEAFGKTIIEAMACATPVVCFNATGPADIIEHQKNGYAAMAFESLDLAVGVKWLISDEMRRKELGNNARLKVEEEFDINNISKKYIQLYESLLDKTYKNM